MKLKSSLTNKTEIDEFNEFIKTLDKPIYRVDFNSLGQIIEINTKDKKIIAYAKDIGLE